MPLPSTMTPIATTTLSTATASITFSAIPPIYTDLILVAESATTTSFNGVLLQVNSDTGANYSVTLLLGDGSAGSSTRSSGASSINLGLSTNASRTNSIFQFQNYSNTTTYKTILGRGNSAANQVRTGAGLWRNTAAINSITVFVSGDTFISGSSFTIYGIKAA